MSEEDIDNIIKTKHGRKSVLHSDESDRKSSDSEVLNATTVASTPRSSERLRKKSQQCHTIPKRRERLNEVCGEKSLTDERPKSTSVSRRSLTSDFVRGSSRYVTDKANTFVSSDSDLSNFIDDSFETKHRPTTRSGRQRNKKRRTEKQKLSTDSDSDTESKQKRQISSRKKRKKSSKALNLSENDSNCEEDLKNCVKSKDVEDGSCQKGSDEESDELSSGNVCNGKKKKKATFELESDDENSPQMRRNNHRRTKSLQKEKEEELLAKMVAKRSKTTQLNALPQSVSTESEIDNICSSQDDTEAMIKEALEEGESDREFVVEDDPESVVDLYNLLETSENSDRLGTAHGTRNVLELPKRNLNNYKRLSVISDSGESDPEECCLNTEMEVISDVIKADNVTTLKDIVDPNPSVMENLNLNRQTLLHLAVKYGSLDCTQYIVNAGCDRLALDKHYLTASAYAIILGNFGCLKVLLQDVIDLHFLNKILEDYYELNVLHFVVYGRLAVPCVKLGNVGDLTTSCLVEWLQLFFELDNWFCLTLLERKDTNGLTPLLSAVAYGKPQCVRFLLTKGSSVRDFRTPNGGTLLHYAVECFVNASSDTEEIHHECCVTALLMSAIMKNEIDTPNNLGFTPLMFAAESGNRECIGELLECGASVKCKDKQGTSSLHLAAASGDTECVKLLVKYGHKVDCQDKWGWPPILYANFAAQESCVLALMEPNPKQIFVLGDLLKRAESEAAIERNYKVVKDVLVAIANQDVYYRVFNDFIRQNPMFLEQYDNGLLHETWRALLDFDNKRRWFKKKLSEIRKSWPRPRVQLEVCRDHIFKSTMCRLKKFTGSELRNSDFDVKFKNEPGIYLGPRREFFVSIFKDLVPPKYKLFNIVDDNQYSLVPNYFFHETAKNEKANIHKESCQSYKDQRSDNDIIASVNLDNLTNTTQANDAIQEPEHHRNENNDDQIIADLNLDNITNSHATETSEWISPKNECVKEDDKCELSTSLSVDEQTAKNLQRLKFFGKIIGTAICHEQFLNSHLSKPLVKQILGIKMGHPDDLSYMDNQLHKSLVSHILGEDNVEDLMLPCTFDVINPWNGRPTAVQMFPQNNDNEYLNEKNKTEYVELVSKYKLTLLIEKELEALCEGLYEVIPKELFSFFTADEFSLLINGVGKIDVDDWKRNSMYGVYDETDGSGKFKEIRWFWEVLRELKEEEKALLLKFSTGSPCVPVGGFAQLSGTFRIVISTAVNKIPMASTCFNMLELPSYDSKKDLKDKLMIAIRHGTEGFSFS